MQSTMELYQKLELMNPDKTKIYVICDNARYYKNKTLEEWLKTSKVEQIFLPSYSPNLNIIERLRLLSLVEVWKFIKKELIHSTFYRTFAEFKTSVMEFFLNTKKYESHLKTLLTLKFHINKKVQTN